jgi:hypothetical protein
MTTEKHDPWALLAEIHELQPWLSQDADLAARVEAALAGRAEGSTEDSATDVVEWNHYGYSRNELRSRINGADVTVRRLAPSISDIDTQYSWNVSLWGGATTLAEAKEAAIAAAKGMR